MFKLQKRVVRILANLSWNESCRGSFARLGILTLPSAYILAVLNLVKANISLIPTVSEVHHHNTRSRGNLVIPFTRLSTAQNTNPMQVGARLFNALPHNVRELPNKVFSRIVKAHLLKAELYTLEEFNDILWDISVVNGIPFGV